MCHLCRRPTRACGSARPAAASRGPTPGRWCPGCTARQPVRAVSPRTDRPRLRRREMGSQMTSPSGVSNARPAAEADVEPWPLLAGQWLAFLVELKIRMTPHVPNQRLIAAYPCGPEVPVGPNEPASVGRPEVVGRADHPILAVEQVRDRA